MFAFAFVNDTVAFESATLANVVLSSDSCAYTVKLPVFVAAPTFSQHGGAVPTGFALEMSSPTGVTWFTTDGTDPRRPEAPPGETGEATLVPEAAVKHVRVPTEDIGTQWRYVLRHDLARWTSVEGEPYVEVRCDCQ